MKYNKNKKGGKGNVLLPPEYTKNAIVIESMIFPILTNKLVSYGMESGLEVDVAYAVPIASNTLAKLMQQKLMNPGEDFELPDYFETIDGFEELFDRMFKSIVKFAGLPLENVFQYVVKYICGQSICIVYTLNKETLQ